MGLAKVVKLTALPAYCADLSFEVGGVVESVNINLGQPVTGFDLPSFYSQLGTATDPNTGPQNLWNSALLLNNLGGPSVMLVSLRAEDVKAALDKACALRANAYLVKFANATQINTQMQSFYANPANPYTPITFTNPTPPNPPPKIDDSTTKAAFLANLISQASTLYNELTGAYTHSGNQTATAPGGRHGLVTSTSSTLTELSAVPLVVNNAVAYGAGAPPSANSTGAPELRQHSEDDLYGLWISRSRN